MVRIADSPRIGDEGLEVAARDGKGGLAGKPAATHHGSGVEEVSEGVPIVATEQTELEL
jgi:hypothetical protein